MARPRLGPAYRKLWTASTVSNLGDGITLAAAPLLAASLTRDPTLVAGLPFANRLPWLVFPLISGAIVDRLDRRVLMVTVNALRSVLVGVLGLAILGGWTNIYLLYAVFFLLGTAQTFFDIASQSIRRMVVPRELLEKANGRLYAAQFVANFFVGPPLGGLLFAATLAAVPFLIDAGSFAAAAFLIFTLSGDFRAAGPEGSPRAALGAEIVEGLRWLRGHRLLRDLALMLGVLNLAVAAPVAVLVLFVQERLALGSLGYGLLLSAGALGGVLGSLVVEKVTDRIGAGRALLGVVLLAAGALLVVALNQNPIVVGAMFALGGLAACVWNVVTISFRQAVVPGEIFGRVTSLYRLLAQGALSVGALLGGFLAEAFGLTAPFWFAAALLVVVALAALPVMNNDALAAARKDL